MVKEMHYQENTLFDLDPKVKGVTATKFEVAISNGLGGDTFTRNVMVGHTDLPTDRRMIDLLWYEINIPFFLKKKAGIKTY